MLLSAKETLSKFVTGNPALWVVFKICTKTHKLSDLISRRVPGL